MKKVKGLIIMLLISLSLFGMTACDGENYIKNHFADIKTMQTLSKTALMTIARWTPCYKIMHIF